MLLQIPTSFGVWLRTILFVEPLPGVKLTIRKPAVSHSARPEPA